MIGEGACNSTHHTWKVHSLHDRSVIGSWGHVHKVRQVTGWSAILSTMLRRTTSNDHLHNKLSVMKHAELEPRPLWVFSSSLLTQLGWNAY